MSECSGWLSQYLVIGAVFMLRVALILCGALLIEQVLTSGGVSPNGWMMVGSKHRWVS
ncbi:MAG: hypothetical protein QXH56_06215 [Thermoprotei archaeon]